MGVVIAAHGGESIKRVGDPSKNSADYTLQALGYSDSFSAMVAIQSYLAPLVAVGSAILSPWEISLDHDEADNWTAKVSYVTPEQQEQSQPPQPNFPELSLEVGTETQHVTQGLEVRDAWPPGLNKSYFNGQINVEIDAKGNMKTKGVDVPVGKLTLNVDFTTPQPSDPFAMGRALADAAPGVNSTTWYGFPQGTLRYMGASVRGKKLDQWKMRLTIDASPNVTIPVDFGTPESPNIVQCQKRGWDYFWIHYRTKIVDHGDAKEVQSVANMAFSHRMFNEFDFRYFGLGG